jgi:Bacterial antitoxin of type II TA system, VapB
MRINIEIDDVLMREAQRAFEHATKKKTVEEALRLMIRLRRQRKMNQDGVVLAQNLISSGPNLRPRVQPENDRQCLSGSDQLWVDRQRAHAFSGCSKNGVA